MYLMLKVRKGSESSHQDCLRHKIIKLLERSKGFFIASKIFRAWRQISKAKLLLKV